MPYQFKREPLRGDEAERLYAACRTFRERLIVGVLLDTGVRVSELCSLTAGAVNFQSHRVTVYGKGGPHGAKSKRRILPLSSRAAELLERNFAVLDTFPLSERPVQRLLKRLAARAGIARPVSPHVLRHTFAVACLKKRMSLVTVSRLLGHDHLKTTEVYLNLSPEDVLAEFAERW